MDKLLSYELKLQKQINKMARNQILKHVNKRQLCGWVEGA